jgi:hypothetical protein
VNFIILTIFVIVDFEESTICKILFFFIKIGVSRLKHKITYYNKMEDNNKKCSGCKKMLSLTCFNTNRRTGELFKTCARCLEYNFKYRERHDDETRTCPRCKEEYRIVNWNEKNIC